MSKQQIRWLNLLHVPAAIGVFFVLFPFLAKFSNNVPPRSELVQVSASHRFKLEVTSAHRGPSQLAIRWWAEGLFHEAIIYEFGSLPMKVRSELLSLQAPTRIDLLAEETSRAMIVRYKVWEVRVGSRVLLPIEEITTVHAHRNELARDLSPWFLVSGIPLSLIALVIERRKHAA